MQKSRMHVRALLSAFIVLLYGASAQAVDFQPPTLGSTFTFNEDYSASFNIDGTANGTLTIDATTTFRFVDVRQYTQQCPELQGGTYDVFYLEWTGTANLSGRASLTQPIPLSNVPIRLNNATFNGKLWLRTSDLATVAKVREISGTAEVDLFGFGQWQQVATLDADQFEEYITPLEDFRWPLNTTNPEYIQQPSICAFGDYLADVDLAGLFTDTFDGNFSTVLDINFSVSVPRTGTKNVGGRFLDYTVSEEYSNDFGAAQSFWYAPELRWILKQEISSLAVADLVTLDSVTFDLTSFNIPAVTPTPTITTTPTVTQTATPSPTVTQTPSQTVTPTVTQTPTGDTRVRVLHLSPDAPAVDIFVNGARSGLTNIPFPASSNFVTLPAGTYSFDVVPANGNLGDSVLNVSGANLAANKAYSAIALNTLNNIEALLLEDDLSPVAANNVRLRVVHAAAAVGQVDIWNITNAASPSALATDVDFKEATGYLSIPAGAYKLGVDTNNDATPDLVFDTPSLAAGSVITAYAVNETDGDVFLYVNFQDGTAARIDPTPITTDNEGPHIVVAGFLSSYITTANGGNLTLLAYVTDPDGDAIQSVELWYAGASLAFPLTQIDPVGLYQATIPFGPGTPALSVTLELKAFDNKGNGSMLWPYLDVRDDLVSAPYARGPEVTKTMWTNSEMLRRIEASRLVRGESVLRPATANGPFIIAGGYFNTSITVGDGGDVTFGVLTQPAPGASISRVELFLYDQPTGVDLTDGVTFFGPGTYGIVLPDLAPGALPEGQFKLGAVAYGSDGQNSDIWPNLVIH